jgi:hypothetical protein
MKFRTRIPKIPLRGTHMFVLGMIDKRNECALLQFLRQSVTGPIPAILRASLTRIGTVISQYSIATRTIPICIIATFTDCGQAWRPRATVASSDRACFAKTQSLVGTLCEFLTQLAC